MTGDRILALDVGTQSVRAMIVDPAGNLLARTKVPIEAYAPGPPGWCEQDPEVYWRALAEACGRLWEQPEARRDALAGVALTTQRSTVVITDEEGRPLRPAMVWLDRRRAEGLPRLGGKWGLAFKALGVTETVATFRAEAEANVLARDEPATWARTRHFLFLSGYLVHGLTGRFVDSVASQVGYVPFDYKAQAWAKSSDWKWDAIPVDRGWLPELVPPGQPLGSITSSAAAATGIPEGLPLLATAGDKACEVLGSGALDPHVGAVSLGTTASFNTTHMTYVEVIPMVPPYPAAVPGRYSLEVNVYRGYWMIEWFKREFGAAEVVRARELGVDAETLFDELVAATPPGSMGLILQPYWSPGVRVPGPRGQGRGHRLGRRPHPRPPLPRDPRGPRLRAARRRGADGAADQGPVTEVRVSGGGSQSPAPSSHRRHLRPARGAAAHARDIRPGGGDRRGRRARLHPSFEAAVAAMTRVAETREPDPANPRCTRTSTATSTCGCTSASSRSTRRSGVSRATRRRRDPAPEA